MGVKRCWVEEYDGTGDPAEFISRTGELAEAYGIELDHAAGAMVILLRGCALDWWHTHPTPMPSWSIFRKVLECYRPADHEQKSMESITVRRQRQDEPAKEYTRKLRKNMRFTTLTEEKKLEWAYRNSRVEFKRYAKHEECRSMANTLSHTPVENLQRQRKNTRPPKKKCASVRKKKLMVVADALSRMLKEKVHGADVEEAEWIKQKLLAIDRDPGTWPYYAVL